MMDMDDRLPLVESALAALAHTMAFHFGGRKTTEEKQLTTTSSPPTNNNIVDLASFISSNWKRQVDALALPPVEELKFYKRQYDQLINVLHISLFDKLPNSDTAPLQQPRSPSFPVAIENAKNTDDQSLQKKPTRTKRNALPNNDYEIIVFKHEEQQNRYLSRRVESVEKYAKRKKILRYIHITIRSDESKNLIAAVRKIDPTFVVGKEIHYDEGQSVSDLYKKMKKKIDQISFVNRPSVKYVEEEDTNEDDADGQPTRKKTKTARTTKKETNTRCPTAKDSDRRRVTEQTLSPSNDEINTDLEDEPNDEDDRAKKRENYSNSDSDSESIDNTSVDSDEEDKTNKKKKVEVKLHQQQQPEGEEYIPVGKTDTTVPRYVPTSKAVSLELPTDAERNQDNPLSPLFPDSQGTSKKRKHH